MCIAVYFRKFSFKLTHIILNLEIEIPNKTILFFLNNHNLAFPVQLLRVGRPYFPKFKIFFNKELGNHKQMSGSEGFISVVTQIT